MTTVLEYEEHKIYESKKFLEKYNKLNKAHKHVMLLVAFQKHYPDIKIDPSKVKVYGVTKSFRQ
jgi:hypothetical protein